MDLVLTGLSLMAGFAGSWGLTGWWVRWASQRRLFDFPNARSSHQMPTPRGGGVAFVVIFLLFSLLFGSSTETGPAPLVAVLGGGTAVAAAGFLDDLGHVPVLLRLTVHLAASIFALAVLAGLPTPLAGAGWPLAVLGVVWLINLYNFMDGIDGLASVEAITVAVGAALILFSGGETQMAWWLLGLAVACAGFLVWNWPPAKIFMGDVGSGFLGFVLAVMALATIQTGAISLWAWAILLAVFVTDASVTLLRRMIRGEKWWRAHRTHAYQHLAQKVGHRPVTVAVAMINLCWLFPLAWIANGHALTGALWSWVAYLPLVYLAIRLRAGQPA